MTDRGLLRIGLVGTLVAAACCFTPVLVIVFASLGVSAWLGWIDRVLLPVLGLFVAISMYALIRIARRRAGVADAPET